MGIIPNLCSCQPVYPLNEHFGFMDNVVYAIAAVLDHSQLSTARRYAKHDTESMREVVNLLDRKNGNHVFITLNQEEDKAAVATP